MENLNDPAFDEEEPLTQEELERKMEISVGNELTEAAKAFHLKTAAYVMSMDHYKRVRRALGHQEEDPANPWQPVQGDMVNGYPIMVVDGENIRPHIEMVERDLRPSYYAGVTSLGIERPDMVLPEFQSADPLLLGGFSETEPAPSVRPGHEEESETASGDAAPAS